MTDPVNLFLSELFFQLTLKITNLLRHGNNTGLNDLLAKDGSIPISLLLPFLVLFIHLPRQIKKINFPDDFVLEEWHLLVAIWFEQDKEKHQKDDSECKKRLTIFMKDDKFWVMANHGHTITIERDWLPVDPTKFPVIFHGTFVTCFSSIIRNGILKMQRIFVCASVLMGVGRKDSEIGFLINVKRLIELGIIPFFSTNGKENVVQVDNIPPEAFVGIVACKSFIDKQLFKRIELDDGSFLIPTDEKFDGFDIGPDWVLCRRVKKNLVCKSTSRFFTFEIVSNVSNI
jgi:hypothetical protein